MTVRSGSGGTALTGTLVASGAHAFMLSIGIVGGSTLRANGIIPRIAQAAFVGNSSLRVTVIKVSTEVFFPCESSLMASALIFSSTVPTIRIPSVVVDTVEVKRDDKPRYSYS